MNLPLQSSLVQYLQDSLPTLFFHYIASQAKKWILGVRGWRADRGRKTTAVPRSTSIIREGQEHGCRRCAPLCFPLCWSAPFCFPACNGHTGPHATAMGYLAAAGHCCGQGIPAIGALQQGLSAKVLAVFVPCTFLRVAGA